MPRPRASRTGWSKDDITLDIRAAPDIGSFVADERRVRQVLFNLLSNAVGFSPAGATVTLAAERRDDAVVFSVTDHGPGIPPEISDRVFDWFETPFARLAAPRRRASASRSCAPSSSCMAAR